MAAVMARARVWGQGRGPGPGLERELGLGSGLELELESPPDPELQAGHSRRIYPPATGEVVAVMLIGVHMEMVNQGILAHPPGRTAGTRYRPARRAASTERTPREWCMESHPGRRRPRTNRSRTQPNRCRLRTHRRGSRRRQRPHTRPCRWTRKAPTKDPGR